MPREYLFVKRRYDDVLIKAVYSVNKLNNVASRAKESLICLTTNGKVSLALFARARISSKRSFEKAALARHNGPRGN